MQIKTGLFLFLLLTTVLAFGQDPADRKDTTKLYTGIELYAKKSKFTRLVYRLIFNTNLTSVIKNPRPKKSIQKPYKSFEGKIIRNIYIQTLDPFGYSVSDTLQVPQNYFNRAGNHLHLKSRQLTIKNLLLFKKNEAFDSLLVKESERLIRAQGYVREVSFYTVATSKNSDSVDVYIRELDKWSITARAAVSPTRLTFNLNDKNFLGTGHESQNGFVWLHSIQKYAYNANYHIPNIRNTFINSSLHYGTDEYGNYMRSFSLNRPFFSPFAKWAAGISYTQQFKQDSILLESNQYLNQNFKANTHDYWAGHATQLFKGNSENIRTTNFITAGRFLRVRYLQKPPAMIGVPQGFASEDFYLLGIGLSTRKYIQEKFVFNYGITEDVPIGKVYGLTAGYQEKARVGRYYIGARFSVGNFYRWGYFSANYEYGTFFRQGIAEQGVFSAGVIYFTDLFEIGKWKFRQFVKPQLITSVNKVSAVNLSLNDGYGLDGFNSSGLEGSTRIMFTFQTQSYAPWNVFGFRFGPYFIYSMGMLGDALLGLKHSRVYSQFGFGVLIKNPNLVFNTFQISIAFYPIIPGLGPDVFKMNSYKTTDFRFKDFEVGKPGIVAFQ